MKYKAPRGTHDIFNAKAKLFSKIENSCRSVFERYGYSEIRVPTFEDAALFSRSIGESTDIVEKEMYVFEDRKGRKLALRPEGTASVVRAFVENNFTNTLPIPKLFYIGQMFRYERPQAGRYREFFQVGCEYFGNSEPLADAEMILLNKALFEELGIKGFTIKLNSIGCQQCRPNFRKAVKEYFSSISGLCEDCMRRIEKNPLRILDCKVDSDKFQNIPKSEDFLDEACSAHFEEVKSLLDLAGCDFVVDHRLVRGLDYYTKTVFEITAGKTGSQNAISAGGRYDNLVEEVGGGKVPAVGFAIGTERAAELIEQAVGAGSTGERKIIFVAAVDKSLKREVFAFVEKLRNSVSGQKLCELIAGEGGKFTVECAGLDKNLAAQLKIADKIGANKTVIFGPEEYKSGKALVKDMFSKQQGEIELKHFL